MKKYWITFTLILCVLLILFKFSFNSNSNSDLTTLRIAVLPDQSHSALKDKYTPLLAYLSEYTKLKTTLIIPNSYQELVTIFKQGKVDLAYLGGLTFLQVSEDEKAKALVMREIDTRFSSWFIVKNNSGFEKIKQLEGQSFSFGSNLSTSGHLMPRHYLSTEYKIVPESFFDQVKFSNGHDKTVYDVLEGKVSGGAVNSIVYLQMLSEKRISDSDIKVIWKSPPYPDYVWAVKSNLNETDRNKIRNAFLSLSPSSIDDKKILDKLGASYFLPAKIKDFKMLKDVAIGQKLLSEN
ncbi:phosphate/phosphite/phosphonate ABC transporter substrate-binding protein [Pseudoalteromonas denitrificans]|uniref:Phosphonate transport system substrate-binding protein n=1 Tax=Pseudoalteromonas denitrificans DSM 6059 TaxID=1123010 RepID=A0A1I1MPT2_9GAMM|nr:phosphate/phosphite/phosphonate ABC transporter substrate-binding protein [Pseudoalteromonas denitrificans]SFC87381.1 phosphonate transport system substrate-binding protein [Pseudoalteromonas denitrificans DSM 6059]